MFLPHSEMETVVLKKSTKNFVNSGLLPIKIYYILDFEKILI